MGGISQSQSRAALSCCQAATTMPSQLLQESSAATSRASPARVVSTCAAGESYAFTGGWYRNFCNVERCGKYVKVGFGVGLEDKFVQKLLLPRRNHVIKRLRKFLGTSAMGRPPRILWWSPALRLSKICHWGCRSPGCQHWHCRTIV